MILLGGPRSPAVVLKDQGLIQRVHGYFPGKYRQGWKVS